MWEMDDGIIEGALRTRFSKDSNVVIQRVEGSGEVGDLWNYIIQKLKSNTIETPE
jgi:hypothetical protein